MGSPPNETGRFDNEGPVHHVKISKSFFMGKYEITLKQWRNVMGSSINGDNHPDEWVSWNNAQDFIKKLNDIDGGNKYRLPTEAEWEYAARAGTKTRYYFGDEESILGDYAWYNSNSEIAIHDVGQKKPNPWGLYDMYGNVREWVQDKYHANYSGAPTDGSSWESGNGSDRVARGCVYVMSAGYCRSAFRSGFDPVRSNIGFTGFRLVRVS
jgi:formylglycine-generating enzyme required for sulfatase activity